jgi:hypothetical protein
VSVLTAYSRFRFLWGAVDWEGGSESPYTTAQTGTTLGTSAAPGVGVGVRRCVLTFDRTAEIAGADDAECHFDFLNITGGDPDDTWTPTDYTTLEGYLDTWYGSVKSRLTQYQTLSGYRWYRHGPGINPPNPAERVTTRSVAGTSTADALPPQCAVSHTFRTGVRKSWGRTYVPGLTEGYSSAAGTILATDVDAFANALATLYASSNSHDFPMVVVSFHLSAVLAIEAVEVDSLIDTIRRRRWKHAAYRKIINT